MNGFNDPVTKCSNSKTKMSHWIFKIQFYAHINQKKADIAISKFKRGHRWEKTQETQQLNATQDLDWIEQQQQN